MLKVNSVIGIDRDSMPALNLYSLSRLKDDDINTWIDKACVMDPLEFVVQIQARLKELKAAKRVKVTS